MRRRKKIYMLPTVEGDVDDEQRAAKERKPKTIRLVAVALWIGLLFHEFSQTTKLKSLPYDPSLNATKMRLDINITFPELACQDADIHAMDTLGNGLSHTTDMIQKTSLALDGTILMKKERVMKNTEISNHTERKASYCGPCYGAKVTEINETQPCCNTCEDVINAYRDRGWLANVNTVRTSEQCIREYNEPLTPRNLTRGEGCNLAGYLPLHRTAGNFHIAMGQGVNRPRPQGLASPGKQLQLYSHVHKFSVSDRPNFHVAHTIHHLAFDGASEGTLDGRTHSSSLRGGVSGLVQYFLAIRPTLHQMGQDFVNSDYELKEKRFRPLFNYTEIGKENPIPNSILPGVFFVYDMTPTYDVVEPKAFSDTILRLLMLGGAILCSVVLLEAALYKRGSKKNNQRTRTKMLIVV